MPSSERENLDPNAPTPGSSIRMRMVQPGTIIDGKYVVERAIGEGATGIVVSARHVTLAQRVAIKILLPEARNESPRFVQEAQALALMKSPHVVRVIDLGNLPTGAPYIVMEHLDGENLRDVLREAGCFPIAVSVDCIVQACDALAEAHGRHIVHRDLKPENLFLARGPDGLSCVKVLDFGTSKSPTEALTGTHMFLGTPLYMAPEQMLSARHVDARADVWSLGVILYELLTGTNPFQGDHIAMVINSVREGDIVPPRSLRPDVPEGLEEVVLACLVRDANARIPSVVELCARLAPFTSFHTRPMAARIAGAAAYFADSSYDARSAFPPVRRSSGPGSAANGSPRGYLTTARGTRPNKRRLLWQAALVVCIGTIAGAIGGLRHAANTNTVTIPPATAIQPAATTVRSTPTLPQPDAQPVGVHTASES